MEVTKRQMDIVNAAIRIIAQAGYQELTTKNLAKELSVTEAALYRHFDSKNELILKVLEYFQSLSSEVLVRIREEQIEPMEKVRRFVLNRYEMFEANPDLAQVMFSEELFRNDPAFTGHMQSIMHTHKDEVVGYVREAQNLGVICGDLEPIQVFRIFVGSMRFIVTQWNLSRHSFNLTEEGTKLLDTITKLIEVHK